MQNFLMSKAVRGATTVGENSPDQIKTATLELLDKLIKANEIDRDNIVSVIFTLTPDLNAEYPAKSARINLGWDDIPMICAGEIPVPGGIERCLRVMITFNTPKSKHELKHVYLKKAQNLRPDLV